MSTRTNPSPENSCCIPDFEILKGKVIAWNIFLLASSNIQFHSKGIQTTVTLLKENDEMSQRI